MARLSPLRRRLLTLGIVLLSLAGLLGYTRVVAVSQGGTGATTAAGARTALGVAIGTDVQAYDADLTTYAGVTPGAGGLAILDDANATAIISTLGLAALYQPLDSDLTTLSGYTILAPPTISGESFTSVLLRGRQYNLLAADIADLVTNPPTGWAWVNSSGTVSSASISSGVLTINANTSNSYNTTSANPVLYVKNLPPNASIEAHCSLNGNESFEGGGIYFSESRGGTDGVRIGPASSDCDLEAYDGSVSVKPVAMACDDWWWVLATVTDNQIRWWLQTNGSADSARPTAVGTDVTSTYVYEGQTSVTTRKGAYQLELGLQILRTGAVSGAFRLRCNYLTITTPGIL
jgi:hypothetical protein